MHKAGYALDPDPAIRRAGLPQAEILPRKIVGT